MVEEVSGEDLVSEEAVAEEAVVAAVEEAEGMAVVVVEDLDSEEDLGVLKEDLGDLGDLDLEELVTLGKAEDLEEAQVV